MAPPVPRAPLLRIASTRVCSDLCSLVEICWVCSKPMALNSKKCLQWNGWLSEGEAFPCIGHRKWQICPSVLLPHPAHSLEDSADGISSSRPLRAVPCFAVKPVHNVVMEDVGRATEVKVGRPLRLGIWPHYREAGVHASSRLDKGAAHAVLHVFVGGAMPCRCYGSSSHGR